MDWEPTRYLEFADERSRPFWDLVSRVPAVAPQRIVDLGCGPGHLTTGLARHWPTAQVEGVDSSPAMIESAMAHADDRVQFTLADVRSWQPSGPIDVIISNATLQWVPDHRRLLPGLVSTLSDGGWLAFQVPGNFDQPSHRLLRQLATDPRFGEATGDVAWPASAEPEEYLADLAGLGCRTEVWETTYLHVLRGPDPVFDWLSGTGARPVLQALSDDEREAFVPEYQARLREAYPSAPYGTVLPFRRIFAVAGT